MGFNSGFKELNSYKFVYLFWRPCGDENKTGEGSSSNRMDEILRCFVFVNVEWLGSCARGYSLANSALNLPVPQKACNFLDQLTYYEVDQKGFCPECCVTTRIFSKSRRSVRILCGQLDSFSVSYTFDGIRANEMKINVVNIFVMSPIHISPGTVAMADHTLEWITDISLACTKLIKLIRWRKHKYTHWTE